MTARPLRPPPSLRAAGPRPPRVEASGAVARGYSSPLPLPLARHLHHRPRAFGRAVVEGPWPAPWQTVSFGPWTVPGTEPALPAPPRGRPPARPPSLASVKGTRKRPTRKVTLVEPLVVDGGGVCVVEGGGREEEGGGEGRMVRLNSGTILNTILQDQGPDADSSSPYWPPQAAATKKLCLHPVHFYPATLLHLFFVLHRCPSRGLAFRPDHRIGFRATGLPFASRVSARTSLPPGFASPSLFPTWSSSGNTRHLNSNCPVLPRFSTHSLLWRCNLFFLVFDTVLRRRRRGSVTTRKPHPYWCRLCRRRDVKAIQEHLPHLQRVKSTH